MSMPKPSPFLLLMCFALLPIAGPWACDGCRGSAPDDRDWELTSIYQRGNVALADGRFKVAEQEYRKVLQRDSTHVGAHTKLAMALEGRAGQEPAVRVALLADALDLLKRALEREPESKVVWGEVARLSRKAGQPQRALDALRKLRSLDPEHREAILTMAAIQEETGDLAAAERTLRDELSGDPGPVALALGRFLLSHDRVDEGRKILEGIVACPKSKDPLKRPIPCPTGAYYESQDELGALAVRQDRLGDARKVYDDLVKMFPEDYMAWEVLAALDERQAKWVEAEQKYRQSLAIDRVHMSVWRGLGRTLVAQDRRDDARFAYRKADHFLAKNPEQALEMADELLALDERAWAVSLLERARIMLADDATLKRTFDKKIDEVRKGEGAGEGSDAKGADAGGK